MPPPTVRIGAHPLAALVPGTMSTEEFNALKADILRHGQNLPVILYENLILDGRHRYRACVALGIEPKTVLFTGNEKQAEALAISANLHRKTITPMQKALLAVRMIESRSMTYEGASEQFGISSKSISLMRKTVDSRITPLVKQVENGDIVRFVDLEEELANRSTMQATQPKPAKTNIGKRRPQERSVSTETQKASNRFKHLTEAERVAFCEVAWPFLKGALLQAKSPDDKRAMVDALVTLREEWAAAKRKAAAKAKRKAAKVAKKHHKGKKKTRSIPAPSTETLQ